jgi:hypothetical protein
METKECTICKIKRPLFDFYKRKETKDGLRTDCKECFSLRSKKNWERKPEDEKKRINNRNRLKHFYGLSPEQYDEKLAEQDGKCFICGTEAGYNKKPLYVDHNHTTGAVRKLLCQHCNSGLGMFRESPELLKKAADYLRKHNGES